MIYASIVALAAVALAAFWGLLWLMRRDTLKRGKTEQKLEQAEETLNDIKIVKTARNNISTVADKLRDKYTRK